MSANVTHDFLRDTPVRVVYGKEIQGFLLDRRAGPKYWAHYVDGVVEEINPATGFPRPDPDPADRTKRVVIPVSLRGSDQALHKHASRYTGLMRRVVQCLYSRGLETAFSYTWSKTHGILEFPNPRKVGAGTGDEKTNASQRKHWLIEISASGIYAAPIIYGVDCANCGKDLAQYKSTTDAEISLLWAFFNRNESGKIKELVSAAGMAAIYATGSPWYPGMGWAFSASGNEAANVVQKTIFDGDAVGQPDYYQTRLHTINFAVNFTDTATLTSLTAVNGVATGVMVGHGLTVGQLAVIDGATEAAYNGAHVVKSINGSEFTFNIAVGVPSPAVPVAGQSIRLSNASTATASLSASITTGAPGKVTFRKADLGTLWVPSADSIFEWDGIRPFANIVNGSGPVHVFYDGEQKVVTTWSMSSLSFPEDKLLSPHPPDSVIPPSLNKNDFWDGVSFGFHFWGEEYWVGPIPQLAGLSNPAHPCSYKGAHIQFATGHNYPAYSSVNWGFSGSVNLMVDGYGRTRIESQTQNYNGPFRDPGADWTNAGGYTPCGGTGSCIGVFIWQVYTRDIVKSKQTRSESKSGTSALILFPTDREAVGGVKRIREAFTSSNFTSFARLVGTEWHQVGHTTTPGCPFAQFVLERVGAFFQGSNATSTSSGETISTSFHFRASMGINYTDNFSGTDAQLDQFISWVAQTKETAQSSLFFMRGGLEFADPLLSPADQRKNYVLRRSNYVVGGGFTPPTNPMAFIGQV